ncbi:filaggrin-2-like [Penaeus monodon]|uniref:filaggrin-2-like n=1 Tax=Penaeus monodon TaxID=6687 RepID=UPI0018A7CDD2|nr:filaggrin-2-like [Penaeus monodon]
MLEIWGLVDLGRSGSAPRIPSRARWCLPPDDFYLSGTDCYTEQMPFMSSKHDLASDSQLGSKDKILCARKFSFPDLNGFKNVYHKEEYGHTKKFYDDHDDKKYHSNYDDLDTYFKAHKGSDYKGGHYKGGHHHDAHGHKGHQEKGKYHDDHAGHQGQYGDKSHYGHKSSYGDHGGHKGHYGHDDHKGYGHGGHGGGYGHGGHGGGHGSGYSHGGHGGGHGSGYGHGGHGGGYGHGGHGGKQDFFQIRDNSMFGFSPPVPLTPPSPGYGAHSTVQVVHQAAPKSFESFGDFAFAGH